MNDLESELWDAINAEDYGPDEFAYAVKYPMYAVGPEVTLNGGLVKFVDSYGGEGQGDSYWYVFSWTKDGVTRYFKMDGYYASYDGGYYDNLYEVFPKKVEVTQWEA